MKKAEFEKRVQEFYESEKEQTCLVKPTKGNSSGKLGLLYESKCKLYLGLTRGKNTITGNGKLDARTRGYDVEFKQGCSPIEQLFHQKPDYVVYSPDFLADDAVEKVSYVLTGDGFMTVLENAGLIRIKKMTDGSIKRTIQTYKNSNKKYNLFLDLLEEYNVMTLEEFRDTLKKMRG